MQNKPEWTPSALTLPMYASSPQFLLVGTRLQAHAYKAMMRYQIEALSFIKHRYEQDVKLIDDLVASEELDDAFDVCSGFWQDAMSDYAIEVRKVAAIGSELASQTAKRARKETTTTIEDMAARTVA